MTANLVVSPKHLGELYRVDARLIAILQAVLSAWPHEQARVTSIFRSPEEDQKLGGSGVHAAPPPYRAVDLAGVMPGSVGWEELARIAEAVNADWLYDPGRPRIHVAVGNRHGTGPHLHLQVHPRTRRRDEA